VLFRGGEQGPYGSTYGIFKKYRKIGTVKRKDRGRRGREEKRHKGNISLPHDGVNI
jgi:hypothetical protein